MTVPSDRPIHLEFTFSDWKPELLEGLDSWLKLGLISDNQVQHISQTYLVCTLPEPVEVVAPPPSAAIEIPNATLIPEPVSLPVRDRRPPGLVAQGLQSLMAEISVLWLLFLGVFMVVVSSAVLAASQWRFVSPVGQYSILFGYTLAFWGVAAWAKRQPNLQLTARMLQITTLLIIPVNFWMMDGFQVWRFGLGWLIGSLAIGLLTCIDLALLKSSPLGRSHPLPLLSLNVLGLSWLHLTWQFPGFPLIATYLGTIGTTLILFYQSEQEAREEQPAASVLPPGMIAITFGTLLLLVRAVFASRIPVSQVGLAIGLCGWLLVWLSRYRSNRGGWNRGGWTLLLLGWAVCISNPTPWQSLAISGLALGLLRDRLQRFWKPNDLIGFFGIGLQTYGLLWRLIPESGQESLLRIAIQIAGDSATLPMLSGPWFFPFVGLSLLGADRLRRWDRPDLALRAEQLAFLLGIILALLSLGNPVVRSIYLGLATCALAIVLFRRSQPGNWLVYLTHSVAVVTIASSIDTRFPALSEVGWAWVLLGGMVVEWSFTAFNRSRTAWSQSAWDLGLGFAAISYTLLLQTVYHSPGTQGWPWLVTPIALTILAFLPRFPTQSIAPWLSLAALLLVQPLTLTVAMPRLFGLGIAFGLAFLNTYQLQNLSPAFLTVGFGLGFAGALTWQISPLLQFHTWVALTAIVVLGLWLLRDVLRGQTIALSHLYATAVDTWAILLGSLLLLLLTLHTVILAFSQEYGDWTYIGTIAILTLAITYRTWRSPGNIGFYGVAWGIELLVAIGIFMTSRSLPHLAIGNLVLGGVTQLAGDLGVRRSRPSYRFSWHAIPFLYALFGASIGHIEFTATTGLYTLGAVLVTIGVGRRGPFRPLISLAMLGTSIGAYELLIYQLLQAQGGRAGDGITLLAILAAGIMLTTACLSRWLALLLRLSIPEIYPMAHWHWALGSVLLPLALVAGLSPTGTWLWTGTLLTLGGYALWQGRRNEIWTYAGIWQGMAAISYPAYAFSSDRVVLMAWAGAIVAGIAWVLYTLPWDRWGWSSRPWKHSAVLLPGLVVYLTLDQMGIPGSLLVAAFYAGIGVRSGQVRWSYLSLLLVNWAGVQFLDRWNLTDPLWYATLLGSSLLYVAQIDPDLQSQSAREQRHLVRSLGTGTIALTALYQSDAWVRGYEPIGLSILTLGFALALILGGLLLRTRAFLYIGTALFLLKVLRQLWLLIEDQSLLLWAIGIVLGLLFIWVAATFESRRQQMSQMLNYWISELEDWA